MQSHSNCDPIFFNAKATHSFKIFEVRKAMNRFIDLDALNETLYGGMGLVQTSIWAVGTSGEVPWPDGYYYDPDEGLELLAQAGVAPEDIKLSNTVLPTTETRFDNIKSQLAAVGINFEYEFLDPASSFNSPVYGSSLIFGPYGYTDAKPYVPWTLILMPDALLKAVYTDLYDPELYDAMCSTYEAMMTAFTWEEMLENSKALTDMVQRDYCAMPGVQKPYFAAFNKDLKGIVLVTDEHVLLWNYLYL